MHLLLASVVLLFSWQSHAGGMSQNALVRDGNLLRYTQTSAGHAQTTMMRIDSIGGVSIQDLTNGYNVLVRPVGAGPMLSMHFDGDQRYQAESTAQQIRSVWLRG